MSRAYGYASYGGPEIETWFDRPQPVPGPSELVIKVKAVALWHALANNLLAAHRLRHKIA